MAHTETLECVGLSGDFPFGASGAIDNKLVVWDLNTLQPRNTLPHDKAAGLVPPHVSLARLFARLMRLWAELYRGWAELKNYMWKSFFEKKINKKNVSYHVRAMLCAVKTLGCERRL